jgi:uncharacterized membrane protein
VLPFSIAVRAVDEATRWRLLDYGPEGARALTAALASSALTYIVFLFSALLVALQVASAQLSPRVIARGLRDRRTRLCLGLFVFTFLFGVGVLGRLESSVGQLRLFLVFLLNLASIAAFLYLVAYLGDYLPPISVLTGVGGDGAVVIEQVYPDRLSDPEASVGPSAAPRAGLPAFVVEHTGRSGVVRAFDVDGLIALAHRRDWVIALVPQVGDFVSKGDALFRVYGASAPPEHHRLRESIALGPERTVEQDPAFALRIIVDIGSKALSPAINDATTAVLAIDQLHRLLRTLGLRRLDTGIVRDRDGQVRLRYRTPDWEDFVWLAVTELRHHGAGQIQVMRRLRAMLENLIAGLPPERAAALETELALLARTAMRSFVEPEDQVRASQRDSLGVGGHDKEATG